MRDVTIHRLCVQGPDRLSVYFVPGRHIDQFRMKAERAGRALPVSISMGLDPAIYLAACFEPPTTPLGLRRTDGRGRTAPAPWNWWTACRSAGQGHRARRDRARRRDPAGRADSRRRADRHRLLHAGVPGLSGQGAAETAGDPRHGGHAPAQPDPPDDRRSRRGAREPDRHPDRGEHPAAGGDAACPGRLRNVYCHSAGGGKYLAILQFREAAPRATKAASGRPRSPPSPRSPELKHVILVDEDVDIFDSNDVLWAMTTRYQGDVSTVFIPGVRCHPLDPSQSPRLQPVDSAPRHLAARPSSTARCRST